VPENVEPKVRVEQGHPYRFLSAVPPCAYAANPGVLPLAIGKGGFDRKPVARRSRLNNRSPRCY